MKLYQAIENLGLETQENPTVDRHPIIGDYVRLCLKLKKKRKSHRNKIDSSIFDEYKLSLSILLV